MPRRKLEEPRLGPLPEPNLLDRLRASWSVAALVPAFDVRNLKKREWRSAALLAVVAHAFVIAGIIIIGKLALAKFVDEPTTVIHLGPVDRRVDDPTTPEDEGRGQPADGETSDPGDGGGGNTDPKPVTRGERPATTPNPIVPPAISIPNIAPSMVLPTAAKGPELPAVDPTAQTGITDAPPAPPEGPSLGDGGGTGVGRGKGDGVGDGGPTGTGGGDGGGPGGSGKDSTATRPGGTDAGTGTGPLPGPGGRVRDRSPKMTVPAKPNLTKAMIEAGTFGTVTIRVTISATGAILAAEPVQTLQNGGTAAAMEALRRCKFVPAIRGGQYVTESTLVRFDIRSN